MSSQNVRLTTGDENEKRACQELCHWHARAREGLIRVTRCFAGCAVPCRLCGADSINNDRNNRKMYRYVEKTTHWNSCIEPIYVVSSFIDAVTRPYTFDSSFKKQKLVRVKIRVQVKNSALGLNQLSHETRVNWTKLVSSRGRVGTHYTLVSLQISIQNNSITTQHRQ